MRQPCRAKGIEEDSDNHAKLLALAEERISYGKCRSCHGKCRSCLAAFRQPTRWPNPRIDLSRSCEHPAVNSPAG